MDKLNIGYIINRSFFMFFLLPMISMIPFSSLKSSIYWRLPKIIAFALSFLLFGLIVHFIGITFLQFVVWVDKPWITMITLWKEIVILILLIWVIWYNTYQYGFLSWLKRVRNDRFNRLIISWSLIFIGFTFLSSWVNWSLWSAYIIALRYDFVPFILLILCYQLPPIIWLSYITHATKKYIECIKWIVGLSLIRYLIISTLPGALKIFWYDRHVYEWSLGERPPAVYYAALDHGAPRNQFLRERPIYFWFYLIAFRPLFFLLYLRKIPKHEAIVYGLFYLLSVFTTFSRSTRWVWLLETWVLFILVYGKTAFKYLKYLLIPLIGLGIIVGSYFYYEIFGSGRNFSNTGHINALIKSLTILKTHRLWWLWAWSAWPASHQLWIGFNPENQYLQILIEYGVFGFLCWFLYVWYLSISWLIAWWRNHAKNYLQDRDVAHRDNQRLILLSCNIGLLGLGICGLVLHSWADKMVIRPLMMIYGLWLWVKR